MPTPGTAGWRAGARSTLLVALALAAGIVFVLSLGRLWPLAPIDLVAPEDRLVEEVRTFLTELGFDLDGYETAEWLRVDGVSLDYIERAFGNPTAERYIEQGLPVFEYRVAFKRAGDPVTYRVSLHPNLGVLGWAIQLPRDLAGATLEPREARDRIEGTVREALGIDVATWRETFHGQEVHRNRVDHRFVFEREIHDEPSLAERLSIVVAGDRVTTATRTLDVPPAASRDARRRQANVVALETTGFALLGTAALAAFVVFLRHLSRGGVRLGRAAIWPIVVFVCFTGASALDSFRLFLAWDPMWPRGVAAFQYLFLNSANQIWVLLVLLAVVAAGDTLDRSIAAGRGDSLWLLARGRFLDRRVALASGRGFLVGLVCGGVMAVLVLAFDGLAGARTALQPRGFFFYPLNSAAPAVTTLLFFFGVSLAEELGYRFFGGTWLMALTKRKWVAVLLPAVVYGLTHTGLDFLPPAEPYWARPVVLTAVGCVWGWAFLRYDALTVVLSHFTADLFIFNWPRLASGQTGPVMLAVLTIAVPLLPAVLWPLTRLKRQPISDPQ